MTLCKILFTFAENKFLKLTDMKTILFHHIFRKIGWIMFIPSIFMGIIFLLNIHSFDLQTKVILAKTASVGILSGSIFIVCSKEKNEDEMTKAIRLNSVLTSIYLWSLIVVPTIIFYNEENCRNYTTIGFSLFILFPVIMLWHYMTEIYRYNRIGKNEK